MARSPDDVHVGDDFLVDFEPGTSLLTHSSLVVALEELLGCRVDVAPEKTLKERIRKRVISEALPL
jgi:predicted nucleotidyltransferase